MTKRICYIHVGPHKTGTTSIQWFLQENRANLLNHGYFVPESGNVNGGHHQIVRQLCGLEVPHHHKRTAAKFVEALAGTSCKAVVISSEALEGFLRKSEHANEFFNRIRQLNLESKLVVFPRNQPQLINSRYVEVVRSFRRSEPFELFVSEEIHQQTFCYSDFIALAKEFDAKLIARPFTGQMIVEGVVAYFLEAIGLNPSSFGRAEIWRNQTAGPFTVSVARDVSRLIANSGRRLTPVQARRCKRKLAVYLQEKGLADTGYCGLTNALARQIEKDWKQDNDTFAQQVWRKPWKDIFPEDVGRGFTPNDFDIAQPDERTQQQRHETAKDILASVQEIIANPVPSPFERSGRLRREIHAEQFE
jgi:hypothetical protein